MGVLACDRTGCPHIMCDRLILDGTQYICSDCFAELLRVKSTWPDTMTTLELRERVESFMDTRPGRYVLLSGSDLEAEFQRLVNNTTDEL